MGNDDERKRSDYLKIEPGMAEPLDGEERLSPGEERELLRLEEAWRGKFARYTASLPTPERTADLIARVRSMADRDESSEYGAQDEASRAGTAPGGEIPDVWSELEKARRREPLWSRAYVLFRSQWSVYGTRGWLATAAAMFAAGYGAGQYEYDSARGLSVWLHGITLIAIFAMAYAFRPIDEGMRQLQRIGYYSPLQQTIARFSVVLGVQFAAALAASFMLTDTGIRMALIPFLLGWTAPLLLFAVAGFVLSQWWGTRTAAAALLAVWAAQLAGGDRLQWAYLLATPGLPYYDTTRYIAWAMAAGLLAAYFVLRPGKEASP
jgi:hypothetical protein